MRSIHLCFTLFTLFPLIAIALDTITSTQSITNGQTLVSPGEAFELGFFTPGDSQKWYVGIWYKKISDRDRIVWVANRDNPLANSTGAFKMGEKGNLVLLDQAANIIIWASNQTKAINPVAKLLDSGNFVLQEENDEDYLWQSFDYPTDTLLPEMKLGWDLSRGLNRYLTSWKSADDPSSGDYSFKLDQHGSPEIFLWREEVRIYRSGPWNGATFSGVPEMKPTDTTDFVRFDFITNQNEVYYSFVMTKKSMVSRLIVRPFGELQRLTWYETGKSWNRFWYAPKDQCDDYRECGTYGICDTNHSPVCKCLKSFQPKNCRAWDLRDASDGCVRNVNLDCKKDGFLRLKSVKLPDTSSVFVNETMSLEECKKECLKNCSCMSYANREISRGGTGCIIWTGELLDMREYAEGEGGQDFYVRLAASELGGNRTKRVTKVVGIIVGIGILICGLGICFLLKRKSLQCIRKRKTQQRGSISRSHDFLLKEAVIPSDKDNFVEAKSDELELPLVDFDIIVVATNNFSDENKLGEGGFGCVYKGVLFDHQEIAVKRLSMNSGQGMEEFKNEVRLIARLQHRNLVRLLGCCIEMEEKLLVYEYMENKSLDCIIFNKEKCYLLDWQMRFNIICGIARGLLYLHQDSRFRIIHRDLKTSNVLLDGEMNPKISDFGMARIFGGDQTQANTRRVVGTYGYMAPEYAMDGLFSVKSDVFSFGVIVLEIVSGKKNRGFYSSDNDLNLLGHAWKLWREEKGLELMDPSAGDSYSTYEVLRCIQVGLLCVQEHAEDRPTMSSVLLMLSSETTTLSQPKLPGFFLPRSIEIDSSSSKQKESCTVNQVTVTRLDGR